jgi:hypothetical protein
MSMRSVTLTSYPKLLGDMVGLTPADFIARHLGNAMPGLLGVDSSTTNNGGERLTLHLGERLTLSSGRG